VIVEDIPDMASWQDLKDFARDNGAARPIEADVVTKGGEVVGIMEFGSQRDVDDAVSHLDKCKICPGRGARHNYPPTTVRVYDDSNRSKSRSKSRSRSRSRRRRRRSSRSPRRSRSRSRRRSRSDRRSRSRSGSRRSRSRRHSRSASRSRSPRKDSRSRSKNRDEENQMDTSGAGEAVNGSKEENHSAPAKENGGTDEHTETNGKANSADATNDEDQKNEIAAEESK